MASRDEAPRDVLPACLVRRAGERRTATVWREARQPGRSEARKSGRSQPDTGHTRRAVRCVRFITMALSQRRYHNGPAGRPRGRRGITYARDRPSAARISAFRIAIRERTARVPAYPRPRRRAIGDPPRAEPAPTPRSGPRNPPARRTTAGRKFAIRSRRVHASFYFVYKTAKKRGVCRTAGQPPPHTSKPASH